MFFMGSPYTTLQETTATCIGEAFPTSLPLEGPNVFQVVSASPCQQKDLPKSWILFTKSWITKVWHPTKS